MAGRSEPGDVERRVAMVHATFTEQASSIGEFIRGNAEIVKLALVCLYAEGHLLIEGVPGVAKTSLAKAIAGSIRDAQITRVQFTPDLLPSDLTGGHVYKGGDFEFREGPVFTNILVGDEINRASPKTQSALLEVMAERQVTADGVSRPVPDPFLCVATQNPIEHQGTYPLPEAQIDRFMMMLEVGYPSSDDEVLVVGGGIDRLTPETSVAAVVDISTLRSVVRAVREVEMSMALRRYVVQLATATRGHQHVRLGVSPRGCVALATAAQAYAAVGGSAFASSDDVKAVAVAVLPHRILLKVDARAAGVTARQVVEDVLSSVPDPSASVWK